MPEFLVDFEVWCSCGEGLCRQSDTKGFNVTIEPCQKCIGQAYDEGYEKGYETCKEDNDI